MSDQNQSAVRVAGDPSGGETAVADVTVDDVGVIGERLVDNMEQVIVGKRETVADTVLVLLARGHVLLEDVPGTGKTMLARSLARSIDCTFNRVQFTPDLLPSDITGSNVFNQKTREFEFRPGPVFANVVLGDEINRAPPKTQSALLEAMEEEQVTVDGTTYRVPDPFTVIATQNTVEQGRTYELPVAQVDRFMKRLRLGYPSESAEEEVLDRAVGEHPIEGIEPVTDLPEIRGAREAVANVTVQTPIREYATALATFTREQSRLGVSPRGTIALLRAAQARAAFNGRDYVIPDDVQREARPVMTHRIQLEADPEGQGAVELVENALSSVPIP